MCFGQNKANNQPTKPYEEHQQILAPDRPASFCIVAFAQLSDDQPKLSAERHHSSLQFFPAPSGPPQFGDPLRGLTADQLAAFGVGREDFQQADTPGSGLGPIFNNVS